MSIVTEQGIIHLSSSTREAEEGGSLWARGHPGLHREFQTSQDYTVRFYLKNLSFIYIKADILKKKPLSY